ncbi:MAG TPA: hypothetical protein VGG16_26350 [Streptosporangiaceae bacterium]
MVPKNRNSSKRKTQRQGLSGNPQRRAEQLEKDRPAHSARQGQQAPDPLAGVQADSFRDLAYRLAGGADEAPWWRDSHERVLQRARALDWPSRLSGIEDQTCELVGGQFYDNLQVHDGGHHQAQWLRALVEYAGAALRKAVTGGGDWRPLWTLLYGVVLTTPEPGAGDEQETARRGEFPDIKDPYATALAELEKAETLLSPSERSVATSLSLPVSGVLPVGVPLVARDAYGSRFLVAAPFGYEADLPDHWYAWDVDGCWEVSVAGAGAFGSADEALAEWRAAVGAAADSELSPGDPGLVAKLLGPCLQTGVLSDMLHGNEPRELIRELYRMRRRARALAGAALGVADGTPAGGDTGWDNAGDVDQFGRPAEAHKAFRAWYRARHPDAPKGIAATAETIIGEWGPGRPLDERSFYGCSPFRVAMTAHLIGSDYEPTSASRAIRLLPEWTEWCAQQSGLPGNLAAPSIAAARTAADALDKQGAEEQPDPAETTPFRHQE